MDCSTVLNKLSEDVMMWPRKMQMVFQTQNIRSTLTERSAKYSSQVLQTRLGYGIYLLVKKNKQINK